MTELRLVSDLLPAAAARVPDRIAVETAVGAEALTYRALSDAVWQGATGLRARGLEPGARVVIAMDGSPGWAVAFFSVIQAGLVAVPVPAAIPPDLRALVMHHAEATVCLRHERELAATPSGRSSQTQLCPDRVVFTLSSPGRGPTDTAVLVFTSGSTSRPRAVELSHQNLLANLKGLLSLRQPDRQETLLSMLPPAHVFELVVGQLAPIAAGARIVYAGTPMPNRLVDAMRDRGITRALAVPALVDAIIRELIADLVDHADLTPVHLGRTPAEIVTALDALPADRLEAIRRAVRARLGHTFRSFAVGGAAMTPALAKLATLVGIAVDVGYGLTEAGPLVSMGLSTECPPGSVGRPIPGVEVCIGEGGEILVRSGGVMRGYFKDVVGSAIALEDHWLRTGDRGYLDGNGFLFVTGRLKEAMVTSAGETLYPEDLEPYYSSALFAEHCVVPIAGPDGNDVPTLVVVPVRPETTDEEIARVVGALRRAAPARFRLAAFVRRDAALPRTAIGKLRRRVISESLRA